jgi:hypothetical protein
MTNAKKQLVFVPNLLAAEDSLASMLEMLCKIPSRILSAHLCHFLLALLAADSIFNSPSGIQEPSLLVIHFIQDAGHTSTADQFRHGEAFDRVGHNIILQALKTFGLLEIKLMTIQHYVLVRFSCVEVNGQKGILITIKTGSSQADLLSSILFLIATKP